MTITRQKRIWGWMFFDWAQQPYATLGLTFVFSPYFAAVAADYFMGGGLAEDAANAQSQALWNFGQTLSGIFIALSAPILGAWADASGRKAPWFRAFTAIGVICAFALWGLLPDGTGLFLALIAFWVGFTASESAFNLGNAVLPTLGTPEEIGKISGNAGAFGYWGGVTSLAVMLLFFVEQENGLTLLGNPPALGLDAEARQGTRLVGPVIGLWFMVFTIPFFLWVRDDPAQRKPRPGMRQIVGELRSSVRVVAGRRSLWAFLLGSMFYRDALAALYTNGGVYATLVLGWEVIDIGIFGVIAAIAAAILTWVGGKADGRFGPKPVIIFCVLVLIGVGVVIVGMSRDSLFGVPLAAGSNLPDMVFYGCGVVIGGAGGALYSASRSMMARHTDIDHAAEAYGLFALTGKATAFLAPALITIFTLITGNNQLGYLPIILLFLLGLVLLVWVKPDGDRAEWSAPS